MLWNTEWAEQLVLHLMHLELQKPNATELEGKKVAVPLGTMAEYVFDESMKVVGADRKKWISFKWILKKELLL